MSSSDVSFLKKVFPSEANNEYRGSPIALYTFYLLMAPMTFRGFVHFLKGDSGVNAIASIIVFPGDPDPNTVIYMFSSLWGSQQFIMLLLYGLALVRYKSFLPLMYVTLILENLFRLVVSSIHPLNEQHFEHTPPGAYATLPMLVIAVVMLVLSTRWRPTDADQSE